MDFDYVEEYRPSLRPQSGGTLAAAGDEDLSIDKRQAAICIAAGMLLLLISAWSTGLVQLIAVWLAVGLFLGPFAPVSVTAGDCRVGRGEVVPPATQPSVDPVESEKKSVRSRKKTYKAADLLEVEKTEMVKQLVENGGDVDTKKVDGEWTDEELSMLKKQLAKHPRGTARRWQVIAESFNGSRTVEDVINAAKGFGARKPDDGDAYMKFLSQRKVSGKQVSSDATLRNEVEGDEVVAAAEANGNGVGSVWSDVEDKQLLSALKLVPKDTPMRWKRIAAAVGGKSKAQCMKRYAELRDGFRSSKGGAE